ncbi:MAG: VWA domain-containing protein [Acidobacteriota bacterium]
MKFTFLTLFLLAISVSAQSGRIKPAETPTPNRHLRPSVTDSPNYPKTVSNDRPRTAADPAPTPTPRDEEGVVKVDSTLVPIPVSVLDANGRAVTTLKLADFELKIDGKSVALGDVTRSESPIRLALMFDNSSSVLIAREFEKEAAVKFFKRVIYADKDMAALFSVADTTRLEQPLTKDTSLLVRAIEGFPPPEGATALLDGIIDVADYIKDYDGRRVIVIVSDGEDTYSEITTTLEKVIKNLQLTNCQVFVVKTTDFENFKRTGQRKGNANIRALDAERRMIEITGQTGGSVYSPIDERELDDAFRQISAELSQQYILSYYPENDAGMKGAFREISVDVNTKQNVTVRTRKGYYVPKR